jgi:hypothetical protein
MIRRIAGCVILLVSLVGMGCGSGNGRPKVYAAKGTVTSNGKPVGGALIVLHCKDKGRENDPKPVATTKDDGTFALTTFESDDGAPAGEYGVTIVWNEKPKAGKMSLSGEGAAVQDKLAGRYGDPRNPKLSASVTAAGPNQFTFDVK